MICRIAISIGFLVTLASAALAASEVRLPLDSNPVSIDPQKLNESHEFQVAEDLFEGLTTVSAVGVVVPGTAEKWETSADGLTWTFHLRLDAKWSDGFPVTALDFVRSFRRAVNPATASPSAAALEPILNAKEIASGAERDPALLGVGAVDDHTLQIRLNDPTPWLPLLLTHFAAMPTPQRTIEEFGDQWTLPEHIVTNGAYRLGAWSPGSELTLVRNPYFHDAASVQVETVRYIVSKPGGPGALARFEAGELDVAAVTGKDIRIAEKRHLGNRVVQRELATAFLSVHFARGEMADERIRRALAMTVDRDYLIKNVAQSHRLPAYSLVSPVMRGYTPQTARWASEPTTTRAATARRLLAEAREGNPLPLKVQLTFIANGNSAQMTAIAQRWRSTLGVDTDLLGLSTKEFLERIAAHNFELAAISWDPDFADPWSYLADYRSDSGAANFGAYADPLFDHLLDQSKQAGQDSVQRMRLLEAAERRLIDNEAVIPLRFGVVDFIVNVHLKGWASSPLARHPARYLRIEGAPRPSRRSSSAASCAVQLTDGMIAPVASLVSPGGLMIATRCFRCTLRARLNQPQRS